MNTNKNNKIVDMVMKGKSIAQFEQKDGFKVQKTIRGSSAGKFGSYVDEYTNPGLNKATHIKVTIWHDEMKMGKSAFLPFQNITAQDLEDDYQRLLGDKIIPTAQGMKEGLKGELEALKLKLRDYMLIATRYHMTDRKINDIFKMLDKAYEYLMKNFNDAIFEKETKAMLWWFRAYFIFMDDASNTFKNTIKNEIPENRPVFLELSKDMLKLNKEKRESLLYKTYYWWFTNLNFLMTRETRSALTYLRDTRSWARFIMALIEAWASEEIIQLWLSEQFKIYMEKHPGENIQSYLNGGDANRLMNSGIGKKEKITGEPDIRIDVEGKGSIYIEVQKSYFNPTSSLPINIKLHKLKTSAQCGTLVFMFFPGTKQFVLLDARNEFSITTIDDYGNKNYQITLPVHQDASRGNKLVYQLTNKDFEKSGLYSYLEDFPESVFEKLKVSLKNTTSFKQEQLNKSNFKNKDLNNFKLKIF